ncbi:unnamed protein product [Adineta steineri]|uniref:Intraflagellar transport protein 46 homolog n=1 Tax=Adineta steineri TaxID=433720 RepID=A0A818INW0_9BILA|nr:unnamed protein product [Adineta steineri]CAF3527550.1 unnamed protein product [Adineta steineri]
MSDEEDGFCVVQDRPYDESLDVVDDEDVASIYTPVPSTKKPPVINIATVHRGNHLNFTAPDSNMNAGMGQIFRERPIPIPQRSPVSPTGDHHDDDDNDNDETQEESESDGASSQMSNGPAGQREYKQPDTDAYDPKMYQDLPVPLEVKDLFKYIDKYQPRDIVLETKLKPFIPEYVPAIGDIDAFLKVPRPDGKVDNLGLIVLDEPSSKQSDPHVLSLKMRYTSKQSISSTLPTNIRTVANADKNPKAIDEWITNISKLQKAKTTDTVQYRKPMPNIDDLMQEWPTQFEDLLKETSVPSADIDTDLTTYTDIACALLDIPVYESRIQSLHALFSLYLGFKNSEHFKAMMDVSAPSFRRGGNNTEADHMIID